MDRAWTTRHQAGWWKSCVKLANLLPAIVMNKYPWTGHAAQRGFTLVEMITIIVILGIIAVVAMPRFADTDAFRNRATVDQVSAALRYAQKVAIASHSDVTVNVSNGAPVNCGTAVVEGVITCVVPNGVTLGGTLSVAFDFMGRPTPNGTTTTVGDTTITTITIEAETGYVH